MYTIPRQYLYCEQTTSGSIVSALYRLDIRCIVYDTAPISILCANNIRPIYNLYCSIVSALYRLDIRCTVYTILGQYPYCVQTIITQYWAKHACIVKGYRYNIVPISHCFLGMERYEQNLELLVKTANKEKVSQSVFLMDTTGWKQHLNQDFVDLNQNF